MSFQIGLDRTGLREDWNRRDVNGETEAVDDPTSDGNVQKRIAELLVAGNKIIGREPQFVPAGAASDSADPSSTATDDDIPF
jgi:hypothetical protein